MTCRGYKHVSRRNNYPAEEKVGHGSNTDMVGCVWSKLANFPLLMVSVVFFLSVQSGEYLGEANL